MSVSRGFATLLVVGALGAWPGSVAAAPAFPLQSRISDVIAVTAGEDTWVIAGGFGPHTVRIFPLPDGATDVQLVHRSFVPDWLLAPRAFKVEQPPLCDSAWSCASPRAALEAPSPRRPKPPPTPKLAPTPPAQRSMVLESTVVEPWHVELRMVPWHPPVRPPALLRVVGREDVAAAAKELLAHYSSDEPEGTPGTAERLPTASRYAVVSGDDDDLAFRVRGAFTWPTLRDEAGAPVETVMTVVTTSPVATPMFPRALLRAEPPRLYLQPSPPGELRDPRALASILADQLAAEGKPIHLERAMPLDADDPNVPNADLVTALRLRDLPLPGKPRRFRLFRYRFRGVPDIGFAPTPESELPHPRELATAFITVDSHLAEPGDPRCPGKFGACYKPLLHASGWIVEYGGTVASPAFDAQNPRPRLVEAPFSLATPVMRDPSPFPPLPTPASATPAPLPAPSASASTPTPARSPAPAAAAPGPRGCTCDTVPTPRASPFAGVGALGMVVLWMARRRKTGRAPTKGTR